MIKFTEKIRKSKSIFDAVINVLLKEDNDLDGVCEVFNCNGEQGVLLKIFYEYNPDFDTCIWAYLPSDRRTNNTMTVLFGHHSDCDSNNYWNNKVKAKTFEQDRARDLHNEVRDYILNELYSRYDKVYSTGGGQ